MLPPTWSHGNPVDIIGDAPPERYAQALEIAAEDPAGDGMLVILTPQAMTDPTRTAEELVPLCPHRRQAGPRVLDGRAEVAAGERILARAGIPTFPYPDTAAEMFNHLWRYGEDLAPCTRRPSCPSEPIGRSTATRAADHRPRGTGAGRTLLTELESKAVLAAYGIPVADTRVATTEDEAVAAADEIGYPVVLKLHSQTITHKTDVGGVAARPARRRRGPWRRIERSAAGQTARGLEHFEGVTVQPMIDDTTATSSSSARRVDPQFGPVLLFGMGGELVEVFRDRALGLPPLTTTLARRMMERTRISRPSGRPRPGAGRPRRARAAPRALQPAGRRAARDRGDRHQPAARVAGAAARARRAGHPPRPGTLPSGPAAARHPPVPAPVRRRPGPRRTARELLIRPIRPEDEPLMVAFHGELTEETVYSRYFAHLGLSPAHRPRAADRVCFTDYDREIALVAADEGR